MNYRVGEQIKDFSKLKWGDVIFCKLYNGEFELRRYLNANKGTSQTGPVTRLLSIEVDTIPITSENPHKVFMPDKIFEAVISE